MDEDCQTFPALQKALESSLNAARDEFLKHRMDLEAIHIPCLKDIEEIVSNAMALSHFEYTAEDIFVTAQTVYTQLLEKMKDIWRTMVDTIFCPRNGLSDSANKYPALATTLANLSSRTTQPSHQLGTENTTEGSSVDGEWNGTQLIEAAINLENNQSNDDDDEHLDELEIEGDTQFIQPDGVVPDRNTEFDKMVLEEEQLHHSNWYNFEDTI